MRDPARRRAEAPLSRPRPLPLLLTAILHASQGGTRVSVGLLNAGEGRNITPAHAHLEFEVRGSPHEANAFMASRAIEAVRGSAAAQGGRSRCDHLDAGRLRPAYGLRLRDSRRKAHARA